MTFRRALLVALSLGVASPAAADPDAGAYLAARSAIIANDFDEAARYFSNALIDDPSNPELIENAITAYVALGDSDRAKGLAERLLRIESQSQVAALVLLGEAARNERWDNVIEDLDAGQTVGPLFDGLMRSWALVGQGEMTEALESFDQVAGSGGVEAFGLYHKAIALASVGDFEGAAEILSGEGGTTIRVTRRGVAAYAEVLSQLERNEDALELISETFGNSNDPFFDDMATRLEAGETLPFTSVRAATDGAAEVYFSIASALAGEARESYTLLYSRMAIALRPDHIDATLLTAELLEELERYDLATSVYDTVPREDPSYHLAELGRAQALRLSDREGEAVEVLRQLAESHSDLPIVHITLGDTLRGMERYEESKAPYTTAIDQIGELEEQHWIVLFARAISNERTGDWTAAEADFRQALELSPNQPQVLNYLGYSFLERKENYGEALDLIERAVELRPDSGYIIDSLGWGLYRLGRYDEAIGHMERAVELMPVDPIVNDHLGDVLWAVGREREAEFQWHRALSFITDETDPQDVDPDRIRRKIEVGLDEVLEEEGAPPLKVAKDDR